MFRAGKSLLVTLIAVYFLTACASPRGGIDVPELIEATGMRESGGAMISDSTTRVDRGDVVRLEQFMGTVRMLSEELSFGSVSMLFGEYFVMAGDRVEEGQLLARLDTEWIDRQIEEQQTYIERIRDDYEHSNSLAEIDIVILQAELAGLNASLSTAAANNDNTAGISNMVSSKSQEIARSRLLLTQEMERQALTLQFAQVRLEELQQQLSNSELRAPYGGIITWLARKNYGDYVEPYVGLMYISNESDILVELTEEKYITAALALDKVVGRIGSNDYELEWVAPERQELAYYVLNYMTPPARFKVINPAADLTRGMFAGVCLYYVFAEDVLRVPLNCIYTDSTIGTYVYVAENGEKAMRAIETGRRGDVFVEVISGLDEGDEIFVRP